MQKRETPPALKGIGEKQTARGIPPRAVCWHSVRHYFFMDTQSVRDVMRLSMYPRPDRAARSSKSPSRR